MLPPSPKSRSSLAAWIALLALAAARFGVSDIQVWGSAFDVAHFLFFAILARRVFCLMGGVQSVARRALAAFACAVLVAAAVECLQPWVGQERNLSDIWMGAAGSATAILVGFAHSALKREVRAVLLLAGIILSAVALWEPCLALSTRLASAVRFPLLASFETDAEVKQWEVRGGNVRRSSAYSAHGSYSAELMVTGDVEYPGISLAVWPRDWRRYRTLCLDVKWNRDDPAVLWVRLDDRVAAAYRDRFQTRISLQPGDNPVRLELAEELCTPTGRALDLSRIHRLTLFLEGAEPGHRIHLDHVRLESEKTRVSED